MIIVYIKLPLPLAHKYYTETQKPLAIRTAETKHNSCANLQEFNIQNNDNTLDAAATVYYKFNKRCTVKMTQQTTIGHESIERLTKNWRDQTDPPHAFGKHREL